MSRGIAICIALVVVGVVLCVVGLARAGDTGEVVAGYPAVDAGSTGELQLEAGEQVGYYESTCFGCEGKESVSVAPRLRIAEPADGLVQVKPYGDRPKAWYSPGAFLDYSRDGFDGGPAYALDLAASGRYMVEVAPSSEPDARVRIGPDLKSRKVVGIVLAIAGFLLAGAAVLVLAAWWISVMLRDATSDG